VNEGYDPQKILVSTFTIKAAEEIKDRIRIQLGDKAENIQISTIHSFCRKMLQLFPEYYDFGVVFEVLDELDQFIYINKNYKWKYRLNDFKDEVDIEELINFYNRATENNVSAKKLIRYLKKNKASEGDVAIAKSYLLYLRDLLNPEESRLDFSLLQREFLHMLERHPDALEKVREMFDYIIIDEYQDTNPIQDTILKLISEPKFKITVVGDEDQSIYGFRGASVQNFRTFLERYPSAKKMELEQNYRSCPEIVETFDSFMSPNRIFTKKIFTENPPFSNPILLKSESLDEEAILIRKTIQNLVQNHGINYGDIAILFKSVKYHAPRIIDQINSENIPYVSIGDSSLLTREEIRDMILLMLYVNSFTPNEYQITKYYDRNILFSDFLDLESDTIDKLIDEVNKIDFLNSFSHFQLKRLDIAQKDIETLINLQNLQKEQTRNKISQLKIFYKILDATGYGYRLFKRFNNDQESRVDIIIRNLAKFSVVIHKFEKNTNSQKIDTFLYHLGSIPEHKLDDSASYEDLDAVKLMTIHQAKGLEFPVVILAGVSKRRYNRNQAESDYIIEIPDDLLLDQYRYDRGEEIQRTFYVGMSRAQKLLIISTFNNEGRTKMSPFIEEIGEDCFIEDSEFAEKFTDKDHFVELKEKAKLSYSSISAYMSCPFRFYCRDILKFQTPIPYFQVYGIIIHNCLQKLHLLIKEGHSIEIPDIIEIVDTYCRDEGSRKQWRDELITELWEYYERTPDFINEVIEAEFPFSYINSDVIINGQVDLVIRNKKGELEIIDYKSRYKKGLDKLSVDIQLRIYNLALQNYFDEKIEKISAYTFKDNQLTRFSNAPEDLEDTKQLIAQISDNIEEKKFERRWGGKFCTTTQGKCEFFYICKQLKENV